MVPVAIYAGVSEGTGKGMIKVHRLPEFRWELIEIITKPPVDPGRPLSWGNVPACDFRTLPKLSLWNKGKQEHATEGCCPLRIQPNGCGRREGTRFPDVEILGQRFKQKVEQIRFPPTPVCCPKSPLHSCWMPCLIFF